MMRQAFIPVEVEPGVVHCEHGYIDLGPGRCRPDLDAGSSTPHGDGAGRRAVRRRPFAAAPIVTPSGIGGAANAQVAEFPLPPEPDDLEAAA